MDIKKMSNRVQVYWWRYSLVTDGISITAWLWLVPFYNLITIISILNTHDYS